MKILTVDAPQPFTNSYGLSAVKMKNLTDVVILAGPNGSGKTRLLQMIKKLAETHVSVKAFNDLEVNTLNNKNAIKNNPDAIHVEAWKKQIEEYETLQRENIYLSFDDESRSVFKPIYYVPKLQQLDDQETLSPKDMEDRAKALSTPGFEASPKGTLSKIQEVHTRMIMTSHPDLNHFSKFEIESARNDFEKLDNLIFSLLGERLLVDVNGKSVIFGKKIGQAHLSAGQSVLLQIAVALHGQQNEITDSIIFLDEPENHLHPKAVIEIVDKIKNAVPNGQIWIATHSIHILSHFSTEHIWFIKSGVVKFAGKIPEMVLESLLGEEQGEKLYNFIQLPASFAVNKFAAECLAAPVALNTGSDDPQIAQMKEIFKNLKQVPHRFLRILDFGAGKGRLLANLVDSGFDDLNNNFTYYAYDISEENKNDCINTIGRFHDAPEEFYSNDLDSLKNKMGDFFFDVIIFCNVLHEIQPVDWLESFDEKKSLMKLLSQSGFCLFVEDTKIPNGELAYTNGFLILDAPQFKILFNIVEDEAMWSFDARNDGRLKASLVPKNNLVQISQTNVISVLKNLQLTSKQQIKKLRLEGDKSFRKGIEHSLWIQQFTNSSFCLDDLENKPSL